MEFIPRQPFTKQFIKMLFQPRRPHENPSIFSFKEEVKIDLSYIYSRSELTEPVRNISCARNKICAWPMKELAKEIEKYYSQDFRHNPIHSLMNKNYMCKLCSEDGKVVQRRFAEFYYDKELDYLIRLAKQRYQEIFAEDQRKEKLKNQKEKEKEKDSLMEEELTNVQKAELEIIKQKEMIKKKAINKNYRNSTLIICPNGKVIMEYKKKLKDGVKISCRTILMDNSRKIIDENLYFNSKDTINTNSVNLMSKIITKGTLQRIKKGIEEIGNIYHEEVKNKLIIQFHETLNKSIKSNISADQYNEVFASKMVISSYQNNLEAEIQIFYPGCNVWQTYNLKEITSILDKGRQEIRMVNLKEFVLIYTSDISVLLKIKRNPYSSLYKYRECKKKFDCRNYTVYQSLTHSPIEAQKSYQKFIVSYEKPVEIEQDFNKFIECVNPLEEKPKEEPKKELSGEEIERKKIAKANKMEMRKRIEESQIMHYQEMSNKMQSEDQKSMIRQRRMEKMRRMEVQNHLKDDQNDSASEKPKYFVRGKVLPEFVSGSVIVPFYDRSTAFLIGGEIKIKTIKDGKMVEENQKAEINVNKKIYRLVATDKRPAWDEVKNNLNYKAIGKRQFCIVQQNRCILLGGVAATAEEKKMDKNEMKMQMQMKMQIEGETPFNQYAYVYTLMETPQKSVVLEMSEPIKLNRAIQFEYCVPLKCAQKGVWMLIDLVKRNGLYLNTDTFTILDKAVPLELIESIFKKSFDNRSNIQNVIGYPGCSARYDQVNYIITAEPYTKKPCKLIYGSDSTWMSSDINQILIHQ